MKTLIIALAGFILLGAATGCKKKDAEHGERIVYQTDFDSDDGFFYMGENSTGAGSLQNGIYTMRNKKTQYVNFFYTSSLFNGISGNIALEARVKPGAGAWCGLRWNDDAGISGDHAKTFEVRDNGLFAIGKYAANGDYEEISGNAFSAALVKGDFNVLRVEQRDGTTHFLINGTEVYTMPANGDRLDICGFVVGANATLQADYFKAIQLY